MKKIYYLAFALIMTFAACETEEVSTMESTANSPEESIGDVSALDEQEVDIEQLEGIQSQFLSELSDLDLEQIGNIDLQAVDLRNSDEGLESGKGKRRPRITSLCLVKDADRCPFEDRQPTSNMWWPENDTDFFNTTAYFSSTRYHRMIFATFSNGTALIRGITKMNDGKCKVYVNVWLRDKQTYEEFSANGGEFKLEPGCASQAANEEELLYYEIDNERSWLYSKGSDCLGQGCFGLEQRGENLRGQLGPNGAAFDSNIGDNGFSNWGWITDKHSGERLWVMDFDFRLRCCRGYH
ncbi:hypothetical protein [Flagellimonas sp.]|uniref:hypothetical protein n=1 Tax=Flagellimonas sp. TaxID=2058762 RepID=UPI003F49BBDA